MTRSILLATAAAMTVGLLANQAVAHPPAGDAKIPAAHRQMPSAAHQHNRIAHYRATARRLVRGAAAHGAPSFYAAPPRGPVYRWPTNTYLPGRGIVDEACNLPTSACPNELRDIH
jgi:hypothetical protein